GLRRRDGRGLGGGRDRRGGGGRGGGLRRRDAEGEQRGLRGVVRGGRLGRVRGVAVGGSGRLGRRMLRVGGSGATAVDAVVVALARGVLVVGRLALAAARSALGAVGVGAEERRERVARGGLVGARGAIG